ncbi:MAG: transcription-repair coupling factor [Phycisphaerae bacterium]
MIERVLDNPVLLDAASAIAPGRTVRVAGVWGSASALAAAALGRIRKAPILIVASHLDEADEIADDIEVFTGRPAQLFPAHEVDAPVAQAGMPRERANDEVSGERIRLCNLLARGIGGGMGVPPIRCTGVSPVGAKAMQGQDAPATHGQDARATDERLDVIVAPVMALLQPVPSKEDLSAARLSLGKGDALDPEKLVAWLVDAGFESVEQVDQQGEFARRGGIVDIFPPAVSMAVRVEFFGDQIDSIRRFDLDTQRSADELDGYDVTGYAAPGVAARAANLLEYLPADAIVVVPNPGEVMDLAREIYRRTGDVGLSGDVISEHGLHGKDGFHGLDGSETVREIQSSPRNPCSRSPAGLIDPEEVFAAAGRFALVEMHTFAPRDEDGRTEGATFNLGIRSLERLSLNTHEALAELQELSRAAEVWVYCENGAEEKRFRELIATSQPDLARSARTAVGHVHSGFHWPAQKLVIVGHHEVFHRYAKVRRIRRIRAGRPIESLLDLSEGDYVVHVAHGIAKFEGLRKMERDGRSEEYLSLRFADNAMLHVPASHINLVQKYIGTPARRPSLSKLGGVGWLRQKARAVEAVQDMAAEMLRVQAMRRAMPGVSYPSNTELQREFSEEFLYSETEDQIASMRQIDDDMSEPRPMDRLLCGDVGYGKTELAMRAALKAVEAGKQVAVLVPTTVLADQHYRTFTERFADFPVSVEVISRFRTGGQLKDAVKRTAAGQVDVLIGTHRLLSRDVKFKDLGLAIIDEEQRFGVAHKEHLKKMRASVDVLTMTATPIPRTLHMSLLGLRDISALSTPPLDRRAIHTEVVPANDRLIREVILRELNRQGQVFFVHNRVMDIDALARHVQTLVPEARLAVGHGQMSERELEKTMLRFVRQQVDVLVCTTIIESGLDIPTANTIIIHNADRFGLAELHQLRGRVGRYKHRAFCYLLLPEGRPVTPAAAKRLKAIEEFSDLGAGFQIAMRDLEIRGAGNILGKEQSGHIAAVGYELYCQLLEQAVRELRGEKAPVKIDVHVELGIDAYIPTDYVPAARQRMEIYRRLAKCGSQAELRRLSADLADAYGRVPPAVATLLDMAEIRVLAAALGVQSIIRMDPDIIFRAADFKPLRTAFDQSIGSMRLADPRTAHWRPPRAYMEAPTLVNVLLKRLRTAVEAV